MTGLLPIAGMMTPLGDGWALTLCQPGAHAVPGDLPPRMDWISAIVPGTVAAALEAAGRFDRNAPEPLVDRDVWYRRSLVDLAHGPVTLRFEGLATIADVFLDDRLVLSSTSMFEAHEIDMDLTGGETLSIRFHALKPHLEKPGPRARWRPRLMNSQGLRLIRTTVLGFMPGWCPEVHAVGPWRPVSVARSVRAFSPLAAEIRLGRASASISHLKDLKLSASLAENGHGILTISFVGDEGHDLQLACAGHETALTFSDGRYSGELRITAIKPWWPHTHGEPVLYRPVIRSTEGEHPLPPVGFRSVTVDRGPDGDGFGFVVNGEKIFCRGSVWTTADIVGLPGDRAGYAPWLRLAKDAGMNMIRVPGIGVYESADFFALCDELGLMVWQDLMLANFDYPVADPDFVIHVKTEVDQFLARTSANPSLAIVCGGSEIWQQGAMLGLPERIWKGALCTETLPARVAESRPDLAYVENSPSGGALPFYPNTGVAHYYGVGAYLRPLDDARRADIRFAAESLAFSNVGDTEGLEGGKSGIPRDPGADWDFEDVRDHYLGVLYGVDAKTLRTSSFDRYLALSRAATGEVMEATFAEWRRPGSSCNGALTFTLQDVMPGPGWGVVDVEGRPKPAWFALKRAFRPVQVIFADEGTNGLDVHVLNETADERALTLAVTCLRDGRTPVVAGRREMTIAPRESVTVACTDLFDAFFDTNYAYRFGPPSHDVVVARLVDVDTGVPVAEAFHFPLGRDAAMHEAGITASLDRDETGWWLALETDVLAQSVSIRADGFRPKDNGFHLAPGASRRIRLEPLAGADMRPSGTIKSLGGGLCSF